MDTFDYGNFKGQCEDLGLVGHWVREMPKKPGMYFIQAVETPSSTPASSYICVFEYMGELRATCNWGGWWWSEPIPKFPPTPDFKKD